MKKIRRFLFVYPDLRPGSQSSVIGETFEVSEADGDTATVLPNGTYVFHVAVIKTILDKVIIKGEEREVPKQVRTDRFRTVTVRPSYLWVEEDSFDVGV